MDFMDEKVKMDYNITYGELLRFDKLLQKMNDMDRKEIGFAVMSSVMKIMSNINLLSSYNFKTEKSREIAMHWVQEANTCLNVIFEQFKVDGENNG